MTIQPITPQRIYDSRVSKGGPGPFAAGDTRVVQVLGKGAVPLSGVAGIVGNLGVANATAGGYVTIWPTGRKQPTASNINYPPGQPIANQFTVELGPTGAISLFNGFGATDIFIDVQGWIPADPLVSVGPSVPLTPLTPTASDSVKAAAILANATRYATGPWWAGAAQTMLAAPLMQAMPHDEIRRLGMVALGLSTALATGQLVDPVATARVVQIVDHLAAGHLTNQLAGWGEGWQTSMWSSIVGRAAWLSWDAMPAATRRAAALMVVHEADYAARYQIKYYRDAAGHYLRNAAGQELIGDSGAEEVAWQGTAMQIALAMLPSHPNATIWSTEMQRFALAAWARPGDDPGWPQITGSNVEPNGQVINHSRIAPDYSTCIQFNLEAYPLFTLAGKPTSWAMREFLAPVYTALNALYVPGTATVTYPQGCDWGTGQQLPYALADAQALVYGYDPGTAATYLGLHLDAVLAQQARFTDGHTYASTAEYNYEGAEEHAMQVAAALWLTLYLRDRGLGSFG